MLNMCPSSPAGAAPRSVDVPVAKDGSAFLPDVRNGRGYTIGPKGAEIKVKDYLQALRFLRDMPKACWRRRNSAGNWGIVFAQKWERREILVVDEGAE
jgi:hypothetical protein